MIYLHLYMYSFDYGKIYRFPISYYSFESHESCFSFCFKIRSGNVYFYLFIFIFT